MIKIPPNADKIKELLEFLYLREKRQEERERVTKSRPNLELCGFALETQAYNRQQKCSHLKGAIGVPRRLMASRDYNVAMHTFPTGETKIWCLSNCGWHVWNRPGWSFKWAVGMRMVNNSSNGRTSSEVVLENGKWPKGKQ